MKRHQRDKLDTLAGILSFLDDHAVELGGVSRAASRVELDALVEHLEAQGRAQTAAGGESRLYSLRRRALRSDLFSRHLRPIAVIAQVELADMPEAAALRYPAAGTNHPELLRRAEVMAEQSAKYRHVFLQNGLAHDYVEQLLAVVDAMDRLTDEFVACIRRRRAATTELAVGFSRAARVVSVLDALVKARARGNRALLAAWNAARRAETPGNRPLSLAS